MVWGAKDSRLEIISKALLFWLQVLLLKILMLF